MRPDLDEKPARQLDPCDISEADAPADGRGIGGPGSGEVQPEGQHSNSLVFYSFQLFRLIYLNDPVTQI